MEQSFYEQVYEIVRLIPKGRVTSYVAIARSIGAAKSSRMVGYAMNSAHDMVPAVPAHRVVNARGLLTGRFHFSPPELMQQLLENEGVEIEDDQVKNFKTLFWDPAVEL
jgi:methylated-DNA-protein-cysteine methyltransferase-like protein